MQEKVKSLFTYKKMLNSATIVLGSMLTLLFFSLTAMAGECTITPSNPYIGDNLVVTGNANPNEELTAEVSYEKNVIASGGKYEYYVSEVTVPKGQNNKFTVRAEQVKNLNIRVKKLVAFSLSKDASDGIATISQSKVPPLTYEVEIYGDSLEDKSSVKLRITASQTITADSDGNFRYEYNTNTMPEGDYKITIGDTSETIDLKKWHSSSSHSDNSNVVKTKSIKPQNDTIVENVTEVNTLEINTTEEKFEEQPGKDIINVPDENTNKTQLEQPAEKKPVLVIGLIALGIVCALLWIYHMKKLDK
ncbi:hypothetical protein SDC9_79679 [bioreactor metagenome]|uniref:Uncharacterized protein n=1 Tax=bioreactor metagenome TaxID=1076179 RepID=A0A644YXB3_9ZZZZ